jgi:CRP-like cAMP-binding protein
LHWLVRRTANVEAKTKCVIASLVHDDFSQLLEKYPEVRPLIEAEAQRRFKALTKDLKRTGKSLDPELLDRFPFLKDVRNHPYSPVKSWLIGSSSE